MHRRESRANVVSLTKDLDSPKQVEVKDWLYKSSSFLKTEPYFQQVKCNQDLGYEHCFVLSVYSNFHPKP
jgi:hypothetical protein